MKFRFGCNTILIFQEPTLKEFGRGDVIATQSGPICPQWSLSGQRPVGQEDCLFLNVYTPAVPCMLINLCS